MRVERELVWMGCYFTYSCRTRTRQFEVYGRQWPTPYGARPKDVRFNRGT